MGMLATLQGLVGTARPTVTGEGAYVIGRMSRHGELAMNPYRAYRQSLLSEGSYVVATNPTPGTAIAMTTSITSFAETAGAVGVMYLLRNNSSGTKVIYPDYIKMKIVQVPTSATHWDYAVVLDNSPVRYTSGGSVITPVSPNGGYNLDTAATLYFGALTTGVPSGDRRLVGKGTLRGVIPTTFDVMTILFGTDANSTGLLTAGSAKYTDVTAPVAIPAGWNMAITMWGTSNAAAPTFEFETGWYER